MDQTLTNSTMGARVAASQFAHHIIGRNPKTCGILFIAMLVVLLIFIVLFVMYLSKYKDCMSGGKGNMLGTNPHGNLNTGSNNPLWHHQMGDAGWGGAVHSTYQDGQSRVLGASAEGDHDTTIVPHATHSCHPAAVGGAYAVDHAGSAKHMSDDSLMRVMNGGSA